MILMILMIFKINLMILMLILSGNVLLTVKGATNYMDYLMLAFYSFLVSIKSMSI